MLNKYKYDTKRTWQVIEEITDEKKTESSSLPKTIQTKIGITEKKAQLQKNSTNISLM